MWATGRGFPVGQDNRMKSLELRTWVIEIFNVFEILAEAAVKNTVKI